MSNRLAAAKSCDSLSNLYLWHIKYSESSANINTNPVVIRFQICIFDILNTARSALTLTGRSCDSLSNLYLWHIKYSTQKGTQIRLNVVIRFQICIFDILNTAIKNIFSNSERCDSLSNLYLWHIKYSGRINSLSQEELWFAFKFVSLTY